MSTGRPRLRRHSGAHSARPTSRRSSPVGRVSVRKRTSSQSPPATRASARSVIELPSDSSEPSRSRPTRKTGPSLTERARVGAPRSSTSATARPPTDRRAAGLVATTPRPSRALSRHSAPLWPKCPKLSAGQSPIQWCLSPASSGPSPHGHGSKRPKPGTTPARAGRYGGDHSIARRHGDGVGSQPGDRQGGQVASGSDDARRRAPGQARRGHPERGEDPAIEPRLGDHPRRRRPRPRGRRRSWSRPAGFRPATSDRPLRVRDPRCGSADWRSSRREARRSR